MIYHTDYTSQQNSYSPCTHLNPRSRQGKIKLSTQAYICNVNNNNHNNDDNNNNNNNNDVDDDDDNNNKKILIIIIVMIITDSVSKAQFPKDKV